jgi:hypothetical protein
MRLKILGKLWRFLWVKEEAIPGLHGECSYQERTLAVADSLSEEDTLETVCHEFIHAACPDWRERKVLSVGRSLAFLLRRLGYRRARRRDSRVA